MGNGAAQHLCHRQIGADGFLAAAQDRRIAAFQAQRSAVRRHVGPGLVDHGNDADGHRALDQMQPIGAVEFLQHPAYGVFQRCHGAHAVGHAADALAAQGQPVQQGGAQAVFPARRQVLFVFGDDLRRRRLQGVRRSAQSAVFRLRVRQGQLPGGRPGPQGQLCQVIAHVVSSFLAQNSVPMSRPSSRAYRLSDGVPLST